MPSTLPSKEPVAMKDSTPGTRMLQISCVPSSEPMVNTENDAGAVVS